MFHINFKHNSLKLILYNILACMHVDYNALLEVRCEIFNLQSHIGAQKWILESSGFWIFEIEKVQFVHVKEWEKMNQLKYIE